MPITDFDKRAARAFKCIKRSLSTSALYLPKIGGNPISIRGPFDDRAQEVDPDTNVVISSNLFTFGLSLTDIPAAPVKGDKLIVGGVTYQVIDTKEDGVLGVSVVLILHKVVT